MTGSPFRSLSPESRPATSAKEKLLYSGHQRRLQAAGHIHCHPGCGAPPSCSYSTAPACPKPRPRFLSWRRDHTGYASVARFARFASWSRRPSRQPLTTQAALANGPRFRASRREIGARALRSAAGQWGRGGGGLGLSGLLPACVHGGSSESLSVTVTREVAQSDF